MVHIVHERDYGECFCYPTLYNFWPLNSLLNHTIQLDSKSMLRAFRSIKPRPGFGGWADLRDQKLCMAMMTKKKDTNKGEIQMPKNGNVKGMLRIAL